MLFNDLEIFFRYVHIFNGRQIFALLGKLFTKVHNLFSGSHKPFDFTLPFGVVLAGVDCHFDRCDVGFCPPVKAIEKLNEVLFGIFDSHCMRLFWLDHLKISADKVEDYRWWATFSKRSRIWLMLTLKPNVYYASDIENDLLLVG